VSNGRPEGWSSGPGEASGSGPACVGWVGSEGSLGSSVGARADDEEARGNARGTRWMGWVAAGRTRRRLWTRTDARSRVRTSMPRRQSYAKG